MQKKSIICFKQNEQMYMYKSYPWLSTEFMGTLHKQFP